MLAFTTKFTTRDASLLLLLLYHDCKSFRWCGDLHVNRNVMAGLSRPSFSIMGSHSTEVVSSLPALLRVQQSNLRCVLPDSNQLMGLLRESTKAILVHLSHIVSFCRQCNKNASMTSRTKTRCWPWSRLLSTLSLQKLWIL